MFTYPYMSRTSLHLLSGAGQTEGNLSVCTSVDDIANISPRGPKTANALEAASIKFV